MRQNLENVYRVWLASTPMERSMGREFFVKQGNRLETIAHNRGMNTIYVIGAFVALSPNNDEDGNYRDLLTTIDAVQRGLAPEQFSISSWGPNKAKAMRILQGTDPLDVLGGPKVINFYLNTLDPSDLEPVTIDGHMVSVWKGRRLLLRERRGKPEDSAKISAKEYQIIVQDFRSIAKMLGLIPNQLQSTLWLTWKRMNNIRYDPQFKLFNWE